MVKRFSAITHFPSLFKIPHRGSKAHSEEANAEKLDPEDQSAAADLPSSQRFLLPSWRDATFRNVGFACESKQSRDRWIQIRERIPIYPVSAFLPSFFSVHQRAPYGFSSSFIVYWSSLHKQEYHHGIKFDASTSPNKVCQAFIEFCIIDWSPILRLLLANGKHGISSTL